MMYKRPERSSIEIRETNRKRILKALKEKKELTFNELLSLRIVSRGALNTHLKALLRKRDIEKRFSKTKDKVVYCLTNQSETRLYVESWIEFLGLLAVTYIARKKLDKPVDPKYNFLSKIEEHLNPKKPKYISWKRVFRFLDKEYWIKADLNKPED